MKGTDCPGWSDQSWVAEGRTVLRVSHLRNDVQHELSCRLCTKQPSFSVSLCQNRDSQAALLASTELESQSVAAKGKKKPLPPQQEESGVRNAPFTPSMERCSCPGLRRERGASLLVQGKERGPCGGGKKPALVIRKETPTGLSGPTEKSKWTLPVPPPF